MQKKALERYQNLTKKETEKKLQYDHESDKTFSEEQKEKLVWYRRD